MGSSVEVFTAACNEVPTLSTSPQASLDSLSSAVVHLASLILAKSTSYNVTAQSTSRPSLPHSASSEPESQQALDSAVQSECLGGSRETEAQAAYPTDAKEREKARRKAQKDSGSEHVVQRRKKIVEEHYDDCGDDMASLAEPDAGVSSSVGLSYDNDDVLSDEDHDQCLRLQYGKRIQCYPIDVDKVAKAH